MLIAFAAYLIGVFALGWVSHRYLKGGSFVKEYFLGNRRLGPWVLAISFAATAISGGSFMGFPALIYTNGWVMALWIAGYMVVPLVTMAVLGKRINQASRLSGAVTIPDLLRDRYESPILGLFTSLILVLFLGLNLIAQFKAGGLLMLEAWRDVLEPAGMVSRQVAPLGIDLSLGYVLGLCMFVAMVVAYTAYGGFWGVTFTDVLEGLVMLFGAVALAFLAWRKVGGLEAASASLLREDPALVYGPGPNGYLPPGLAVSFFFQWTIVGIAQPGQMVRLMSFRDSRSLKRALCMCAVYYTLIYASLLVVFICARALYPPSALGMTKTDDIMPFMIRELASPISTVLAGFLLAAPYAAIMSTVAANLLIVSSSLVRDVYQRSFNPAASPSTLRRISYAGTAIIGGWALLGALNPPQFLQEIIVRSTACLGSSLLAPVALGLFWHRVTRQGAVAGMGGGLISYLILEWLKVVPQVGALAASFLIAIGTSLLTRPPHPAVLTRYFFDEETPSR